MSKHILFISAWTGAGTSPQDARRPMALDLWTANGIKWENLRDAGQANVPPQPNVCAWECMRVDDAGVALLEASPNDYQILICEDVP